MTCASCSRPRTTSTSRRCCRTAPPHSVPVWTDVDGDHLIFFTQPQSRKARNLARDPRVALSITDREQPYRMAQVRGRVAGTIEGEDALEVIDRLAVKYTGQPFPMRSGVVYRIA